MQHLSVVIISIIILGSFVGCDNSNPMNSNPSDEDTVTSADPLLSTNICPNINPPCSSVTLGEISTCKLKTTTCGVNLDDVVKQVGNGATDDTIMSIQAWGGTGGRTDKGTGGGVGGYAQTTTTVNDIKGMFNGSSQIYYFLAHTGYHGGNHCGSAGGSATNVTFEDLSLDLTNGPSLASPPTLLVAGGGGGGCGGNASGFCANPGCPADGGNGGVAIAGLSIYGEGTGGQYSTGMGGRQGIGGNSHCVECGGGNERPGLSGFGGRGGGGGSGQSCNAPPAPALFSNTGSTRLMWTAGAGGKGSSNTSTCDAGGGGGGGGWGGGGGGGHGNNNGHAIPGAGGGSFAAFSTRESTLAPSSRPTNPCSNNISGCVQIQFYAQSSLSRLALPGPNGPVECTDVSSPWNLSIGNYALVWQGDGNLVLYESGGGAKWQANTHGSHELCFQEDGNLVVRGVNGNTTYTTATADAQHGGNGGRLMTLYTNGLLEITNQAGDSIFHQGPFE